MGAAKRMRHLLVKLLVTSHPTSLSPIATTQKEIIKS